MVSDIVFYASENMENPEKEKVVECIKECVRVINNCDSAISRNEFINCDHKLTSAEMQEVLKDRTTAAIGYRNAITLLRKMATKDINDISDVVAIMHQDAPEEHRNILVDYIKYEYGELEPRKLEALRWEYYTSGLSKLNDGIFTVIKCSNDAFWLKMDPV